jgi:hypothetical protein
MNETLVGGRETLPPATLPPYGHLWPHPVDRSYWRDLRCRRL